MEKLLEELKPPQGVFPFNDNEGSLKSHFYFDKLLMFLSNLLPEIGSSLPQSSSLGPAILSS